MKKAIFAAIGACLMALGLMACGGAHAQTVPELFKATNGNVLNTTELRSFELIGGQVVTIAQMGGVSNGEYPDASGTLYAKMVASADVLKYYIQKPGTNRWLNTRQMYRPFCNNGSTMIIWNWGNTETFNGDSCGLVSTIQSRAQ